MRVVFMGTPLFAVWTLEALLAEHDVPAVYTRADAISGRGKDLRPSPVKQIAQSNGIPVETPTSFYMRNEDGSLARSADGERLIDTTSIDRLAALEPDFIVVAAYGLILPRAVLDVPRYGCINVHASLLPRWRGAAPIQRALLAGDECLGVSIMRMEEGLDTGDYCATSSIQANDRDLTQLTDELGQMGARLLLESLPSIADGSALWVSQDESEASYAEKIAKDELLLDPLLSAEDNIRRVRASSEQAPARCVICAKPVTVLAASLAPDIDALSCAANLSSGSFPVALIKKRLILQTADGCVQVLTLKPDGKKQMEARSFAAGVKALQSGNCHPEAVWSSC